LVKKNAKKNKEEVNQMKIRRLVERSDKRRVFLRFIFTFKLLLILVALVLFLIEFAEASEPIKSRIKIVDYKFSLSFPNVDTFSIEREELILKNVGKEVVEVTRLVFCGKENKDEVDITPFEFPSSWCIGVGKTLHISTDVVRPLLHKEIGAEEIRGKIKVFGYVRKGKKRLGKEQVLGEEEVSIPVPKVKFGETVKLNKLNIWYKEAKEAPDFSVTFLSWKASDRVVDSREYYPFVSSSSGYYTVKAKPGRKFIILTYELRNDGIYLERPPDVIWGSIGTDKGHILLLPSLPFSWFDKNLVREATEEEIEDLKIGGAGDELLLGGETIRGRVAFEMLANEEPIEAKFKMFTKVVDIGEEVVEYVCPLLRF
jgi:hypothetical protein